MFGSLASAEPLESSLEARMWLFQTSSVFYRFHLSCVIFRIIFYNLPFSWEDFKSLISAIVMFAIKDGDPQSFGTPIFLVATLKQ